MKKSSVAGIQKRELNRQHRIPFAIKPGFEAPPTQRCQFILETRQGNNCPCGKKVIFNSSYCQSHHNLCHVPKDNSSLEEESSENLLAAKYDFEKDSGVDILDLLSRELFLS